MQETLQQQAQATRPRPLRHALYNFTVVMLVLATVIIALNGIVMNLPINGTSMGPTLWNADRVLISRAAYWFSPVQVGDMVAFTVPGEDTHAIKRVIGVPGDLIAMREQRVYRNGDPLPEPYVEWQCEPWNCPDMVWELGEDDYFLLGDNRNYSRDSRDFGPVPRQNIEGRAVLKFKWMQRF